MKEAAWFREKSPIILLSHAMNARKAAAEWISSRRARLLTLAFLETVPGLREHPLAEAVLRIRLSDPEDFRTHDLGARGAIQRRIRRELGCPHVGYLPCLRCLLLECLARTPDLPKVMGWFHERVPTSVDLDDLTRCLIPYPFFLHQAGGWLLEPEFVPACVREMADAIYRGEDWGALPMLADMIELREPQLALEQRPLMEHLRAVCPHARGCWAIDVLLGKLGGLDGL